MSARPTLRRSAWRLPIRKPLALPTVPSPRYQAASGRGLRSRACWRRRRPVILADEPTASLDPRYQLAVLDLLRRHARSFGAVLAVLHDLALAARVADRVIVMDKGRIVASGTPREVLTAARLSETFGVNGGSRGGRRLSGDRSGFDQRAALSARSSRAKSASFPGRPKRRWLGSSANARVHMPFRASAWWRVCSLFVRDRYEEACRADDLQLVPGEQLAELCRAGAQVVPALFRARRCQQGRRSLSRSPAPRPANRPAGRRVGRSPPGRQPQSRAAGRAGRKTSRGSAAPRRTGPPCAVPAKSRARCRRRPHPRRGGRRARSVALQPRRAALARPPDRPGCWDYQRRRSRRLWSLRPGFPVH